APLAPPPARSNRCPWAPPPSSTHSAASVRPVRPLPRRPDRSGGRPAPHAGAPRHPRWDRPSGRGEPASVLQSVLKDNPGPADFLFLFFKNTASSQAAGAEFLQRLGQCPTGHDAPPVSHRVVRLGHPRQVQ